MLGDADRALELLERARRILEDFGMKLLLAAPHPPAQVYMLLGDYAAMESVLRPGIAVLQKMGESGFLSTSAAYLAEAVYRQGRLDEAEEFTRLSREHAAADDVDSQAAWRSVQAKVLARRGEFEEAVRRAREAVDIMAPTDHLLQKGEVLRDLAEVLHLAGRREEALEAARECLAVHQQKGNMVSADRVRTFIEEIGG
jgi:tetratricopeptide (TPR) repeat protein